MVAVRADEVVVQLDADTRRHDQKILESRRKFDQTTDKMRREGDRMERSVSRSFSRMADRARASIARIDPTSLARGIRNVAIASGVGVTALSALVIKALNAAEAIADTAARAGTTAEKLQELRFAVNQNGAEFEDLDRGLIQLQIRLSQFAQDGSGTGAKAFRALGISAVDASGKVRDSADVFTEVVAKLETYGKETEKAALLGQLMGERLGPKLAPTILQGSRAVEDLRQKARDLGVVMENETVRVAAQASAEVRALSQAIKNQLIVALARAAPEVRELTRAFAEGIPFIIGYFSWIARGLGLVERPIEDKIANVDDQIRKLDESFLKLAQEGKKVVVGPGGSTFREQTSGEFNQTLENFSKQREDLVEERERLNVELGRIIADREAFQMALETPIEVPAISVPGSGGGSSSALDEEAEKAKQARESFEAAIEALEDKTQATRDEIAAQQLVNPLMEDYGYILETARAKSDLLRQAQENGIEVTPELEEAINRLASAYGFAVSELGRLTEEQQKFRDEAEKSREKVENFKSESKSMFTGFIQDVKSSGNALEALGGVLDKLNDKLLNLAVDRLLGLGGQSSGATGFFDKIAKSAISIFGFAEGGIADRGRPVALPRFSRGGVSDSAAIFAEDGPEAAVPLPDGRTIPVTLRIPQKMQKQAPAGPESLEIHQPIYIDRPGASKEELIPIIRREVQQGNENVIRKIHRGSKNKPGTFIVE